MFHLSTVDPITTCNMSSIGSSGGDGAHAQHHSQQRFSLCWNDYKSSLSTAFESLRAENDLVDVTLGCDGHKFGAHKMLLSACSPFFRDLLRDNPCQHPIIILRDTDWRDMASILNFIYSGEVSIGEDQLQSFLKAAEALQIRGLTEKVPKVPKHETASTSTAPKRSRKGAASAAAAAAPTIITETQTVMVSAAPAGAPAHMTMVPVVNVANVANATPIAAPVPIIPKNEHLQETATVVHHPHHLSKESYSTLAPENIAHNMSFVMDTGTANATATTAAASANSANAEGNVVEMSSLGAKPMKCANCKKSFKSRNALLDHEHVHKGTTRCKECGRICSTRGNLKLHLSNVHNIR